MLGFNPIASAPIAATGGESDIVLSSQAITLTQSSLSIGAGVGLAVSQQALITTLNSPTLQAAANYALQSQNGAFTLSSVTPQVTGDATVTLTGQALLAEVNGAGSIGGDNCAIAALPLCAIPYPDPAIEYTTVYVGATLPANSQTLSTTLSSVSVYEGDVIPAGSQALTLTQNSVVAGVGPTIELGSLTLSTTLNSVSASVNISVTLTSQALSLTQNSVAFITNAEVFLVGQTLTSTLNGFRLWKEIDTLQTASCNGWVPGSWDVIQFGDVIYGDDFAIATMPIGVLPPELDPIRKNPPQTWGTVATTTNTAWTNIPT